MFRGTKTSIGVHQLRTNLQVICFLFLRVGSDVLSAVDVSSIHHTCPVDYGAKNPISSIRRGSALPCFAPLHAYLSGVSHPDSPSHDAWCSLYVFWFRSRGPTERTGSLSPSMGSFYLTTNKRWRVLLRGWIENNQNATSRFLGTVNITVFS